MEYRYFIGMDVSKNHLDFTILEHGNRLIHKRIENTKEKIKEWLKDIKIKYKAGGRKTLFCMEYGGTYDKLLIHEIIQSRSSLWLEAPLHIIRSLGILRGKNDKIDSYRIAQYAYLHREHPRLWTPPRKIIEKLKLLRSIRIRLMKAIRILESQYKEVAPFSKKNIMKDTYAFYSHSIERLKEDLEKVDTGIKETIMGDLELSNIYKWASSVVGIGITIVTEMIITTNEFKNITSPKKYACYCGVAPFERSSGVNTKGGAKTSKIGNRRMKSLLHMAAVTILRTKSELKDYYDRRVAAGYNKISTINVIKNKIISRVFACVKEQRLYERNVKERIIK